MSFGVGGPAPLQGGAAVTTSDTTALPFKTKALYVGGAGNLTVIMADGTTLTLSAVPVGTLVPLCVTQVKATGTTATLIVAFY